MLHNRYRIRGGEDESTEAEIRLLRESGHEVEFLEANNHDIGQRQKAVGAAFSSVWSRNWERRIYQHLVEQKVDILHVQNFFPLISPSVYYAARRAGVPVVQAIRNYRLVCPSANLFRDGNLCRECVGKRIKWPGIAHRCYRGSALGTTTVAVMAGLHNIAGTWKNRVSKYVVISQYVADILIADGFPPDKIIVKPNFVWLEELLPIEPVETRKHVLFVGRLTPEKGVDVLIKAWHQMETSMPLKLIGESEKHHVSSGSVEFLGRKNLSEVYKLMRQAACVVMPGNWPEPFGRVAIEAFANGTPVISADQGGVAELIEHGVNGRLFKSGDTDDLIKNLSQFLSNKTERDNSARNARATYLKKYTPKANLAQLEDIYEDVIAATDASNRNNTI